MRQPLNFRFVVLVAVLAIAGGALLISLGNESRLLRTELDLARAEQNEEERLGAENRRLRARQISAAELEVLRADHAALPRLRAELEALKKH
jgi:hypothetical protein